MKKVVKFGGSSLADAHQFSKVADIIHADESRVFVIPSAPGKRFDGDTKVTDMLYRCYEKAAAGEHYEDELIAIRSRYDSIIQELGLEGFTLDEDFAKIRAHLAGTPERDFVASRGEYLNGRIMARYLNYEFIDAADDLSIQVHPDDDFALENEDCLGKTEMWYTLPAPQEVLSSF